MWLCRSGNTCSMHTVVVVRLSTTACCRTLWCVTHALPLLPPPPASRRVYVSWQRCAYNVWEGVPPLSAYLTFLLVAPWIYVPCTYRSRNVVLPCTRQSGISTFTFISVFRRTPDFRLLHRKRERGWKLEIDEKACCALSEIYVAVVVVKIQFKNTPHAGNCCSGFRFRSTAARASSVPLTHTSLLVQHEQIPRYIVQL